MSCASRQGANPILTVLFTSSYVQTVHEIRLDCDADVIVLQVEQRGGIACHTGRESCFYRVLKDGEWQTVDPVLKNPEQIYKS